MGGLAGSGQKPYLGADSTAGSASPEIDAGALRLLRAEHEFEV